MTFLLKQMLYLGIFHRGTLLTGGRLHNSINWQSYTQNSHCSKTRIRITSSLSFWTPDGVKYALSLQENIGDITPAVIATQVRCSVFFGPSRDW